jgi:FKBP-type peptidyl-prolyl cis-trans isomerase 2
MGAIMLFTAMDGSEMPGVIREINGDSITVDFNHPLAGRRSQPGLPLRPSSFSLTPLT